jgi:CHAD domain-containing protein
MFGKPARALAQHAEEVQEVLGQHQDAVIAADLLHKMATGRTTGSVAFTLGLLHARQTEAAAKSQQEFKRVWARASQPKMRRWLER